RTPVNLPLSDASADARTFPDTSMVAPFSVVRYCPTASKLSNAKPIGSISWCQLWQRDPAISCPVNRSRAVAADVTAGGVMSTSIGGGGTVWHISLVRTKFPRSTGDRCSGGGWHAEKG